MRTADAELFQDKIEVSLDGRQIFCLFFGGAVLACMVFVLGIMVGKRLEARSHVAAPVADTSRDPLAALDQLNAREAAAELSFTAALTGDGPVEDPLLAAAPQERVAVAADAPPDPADAAKPTADKKPTAGKKPAPAPTPADKAEKQPSTPAPAAPTKPAAKAAAPAPPAKPAASVRARFTLQMSSFQDRTEADAFHAKLRAAGYKPYIVEAQVPDKGTWYRVRLGKYASYEDAIAAKKKFEDDQHIIAYVTRL